MPRSGWQPLGLAFDKAGNLYVTDLSGPYQKVLVIDRTAQVVRTVGETRSSTSRTASPSTTRATSTSTDSNNGRLLVFDPEGRVRAQVGRGAGEGNLGLPRGVAVDGNGRVSRGRRDREGVFVVRGPDRR